MRKMGFDEKWVKWMGMCIANYQMFVNGDGIGLQDLGRGLQQVDPFSLYLFIFYVEGLSAVQKD